MRSPAVSLCPLPTVVMTLAVCLASCTGGGTGSSSAASTSAGASGGSTSSSSSSSSSGTVNGAKLTVRVYVAGESIERRNRFVAAPFAAGGALNDRGGGEARNDQEEYGWAVPFADRLHLRDTGLTVAFVGSDTWLDADDNPYDGSYPSTTAGATSAISGTDIESWLQQRQGELTSKKHCYDVAFASRGGNDFGNEDDQDYKARLKGLIKALSAGSSCRTSPLVYVTGHMPDDQRGGSGDPPNAAYVAQQKQRFVTRVKAAVSELGGEAPEVRARFVDLYTPFLENKATTAFPGEVWSKGGVPDYAKITRVGDMYHPRRLASIYAGENAADSIDIGELRAALK